MPNASIPLQVQSVDAVSPLLLMQERERQSQQDQMQQQQFAQQTQLRDAQLQGQRTQNQSQDIALQRQALQVMAADTMAFAGAVENGNLRGAAALLSDMEKTMQTAGIPTENLQQVKTAFKDPEQLKQISREMVARAEPYLGNLWEEVKDDSGNVVAQKSPEGKLESVPESMRGDDPLDQYIQALELENKTLDNERLSLQVQAAQQAQSTRAQEAEQAEASRNQGRQALQDQAQLVANYIQQAVEMADTTQSGHLGSALSVASPSGQNAAYRRLLQTIRSNVGFDKLMQMKSDPRNPTGGALGQVTERELSELQAVLGSMDPRSSDDEIKSVLSKIYDVYRRVNEGAGGAPLPPLGQVGTTSVGQQANGQVQRAGRFQVEVIE